MKLGIGFSQAALTEEVPCIPPHQGSLVYDGAVGFSKQGQTK